MRELDPRRWKLVQELFHRALEHPPSDRGAVVREACPDDADVAAEVLELLEEDDGGSSPLDRQLAELAEGTLSGSPTPASFGPYRVIRPIGRGGMGVVYLAERTDIAQRVAIKMLRDAELSPVRRERFVREQRTLARLEHPSIARLYAADALADGTPYFVMEYVEGRPIDEYCQAERSTMEERLRLVREVCHAVEFAHRHAVIHRDIKPSNVLVAVDTGRPYVKLLDFGIAKQVHELDLDESLTRTGLRLMTPAYAAPEQLRGDVSDVQVDVYALGVLLYVLLTGRHPFLLESLTPGQAEQRILAGHPKPPSAAARTDGGQRRWQELDALVLQAMHCDPRRRYPTVEALGRDIDHFLLGRPLAARRDSWTYRTRLFASRNRGALLAAGAVSVALASFLALHVVQLTEARDRAVAAAARTQRTQDFLLDLFRDVADTGGFAKGLTAKELVDRGVRQANALEAEPALRAELRMTLGTIYHRLGEPELAEELLQASLNERRHLYGERHPDVAASLTALGALRRDQSDLEAAERLTQLALQVQRERLPSDHPDVVTTMIAYGDTLIDQGRYDETIEVLRDAVAIEEERGPGAALAEALRSLANAYSYAGRDEESDRLNRRLLVLDRQLYGARHPNYASDLINLGSVRERLRHMDEAEALYRDALSINAEYYGRDHPVTASNLSILGGALSEQGQLGEADQVLEEALRVRERVHGKESVAVGLTLGKLATVALAREEYERARPMFERQLEIFRHQLGGRHTYVAGALVNLADLDREQGMLPEAEAKLREALRIYETVLPLDDMRRVLPTAKLGIMLHLQGNYEEAEERLLEARRALLKRNPDAPSIAVIDRYLRELYEATGRSELAARFR